METSSPMSNNLIVYRYSVLRTRVLIKYIGGFELLQKDKKRLWKIIIESVTSKESELIKEIENEPARQSM